ncbi:MAG: hypothetical protein JWP01_4141 [Myxococcales bacterium]|nr:hypothetical protein [Myxococcales bacterium]
MLAALSIASLLAACAGSSSSECAPGAPDAVASDAPAGDLGPPGPFFAGTTCHCDDTTSGGDTTVYMQDGSYLIGSRSSDATTCTVRATAEGQPPLMLHSNGVAETTAVMGSGIDYSSGGTWRCDRGAFRLEFPTHTQAGALSRQFLIAPPQCQLYPCEPGLRCSKNPTDAARNACIADGSLPRGVSCNEDVNCASGTCQNTSFATFKVCG